MSCRALTRRVVALLLLCGLAAGALAAPEPPELLIVDVYLNGQSRGEVFVLRDSDGGFLVNEQFLVHSEVVHPWPEAREFQGQRYYRIDDLAGASADFDARLLALRVELPAALLPLRNVSLERGYNRPRVEDTGAYLDYDVNWISHSRTAQETIYSLLRPVVFGRFGNLAADLTYRDYSGGNVFGDNDETSGLKVLALAYTRDDPARMRTLKVGDIVTRPGLHGYAVRMAGVQLATNFDTRPTFIRYPLPSFYGETAVPSVLDVYINGQLRRSEQVEAGRYVLEDIPAINGAGQMQIVTRDAMGRQQVFAEDFYLATDLLREGLSDYSLNVGVLRERFALENFEYGEFAASATWRYGLRSDLTVTGHGEYSDRTAMIGGGAQHRFAAGGTGTAGLALSHSDAGTGYRWQVGYGRQASRLSYNVDASGASAAYTTIGQYSSHPSLQLLASAGKSFYEYGSLGLSLIHQEFHDSVSRTIWSATHSKTFSNFLSLTSYISVISAETDDVSAGIRFSIPFGDHHSMGGSLSRGGDRLRADASIRRAAPLGAGYGYHLGVSASDNTLVDAGVLLQSEIGRYSADVRSSSAAGSIWEVGTSGSLAYLSGMTAATRQIRDAFAVVNVGGIEGVRVYKENQEIGRTDENGQLFIPALRPYLGNQLRVELMDVPMNARVGNPRSEATPYYRSGVVVNFDISITTNVLLRAVYPDGSPLPEGAIARIRQSGEYFPVGMDGALYLQGIDRASEIEIRWSGATCDIDVPYPSGSAIISRIGDVVCQPRN
jgi:outer membrane usher protein